MKQSGIKIDIASHESELVTFETTDRNIQMCRRQHIRDQAADSRHLIDRL